MRLELVCPEAERSFFVRTPTAKEYWEFYDECRKRPDDANENFIRRMAEDPQKHGELLADLPGLAELHSQAIQAYVGGCSMRHAPLRATTPAEEWRECGLVDEIVQGALAAHPRPYDLRMARAVFRDETGLAPRGFILRRPPAATYKALQQPTSDAVIGAALDCAVFPGPEEMSKLLEELPALGVAFTVVILAAGGAFAEVRAKKH